MLRVVNLHHRAIRHYKRCVKRGDYMDALMWLTLIDRQLVTMRNRKRLLAQKHKRKSLRKNRKPNTMPKTQPFNPARQRAARAKRKQAKV